MGYRTWVDGTLTAAPPFDDQAEEQARAIIEDALREISWSPVAPFAFGGQCRYREEIEEMVDGLLELARTAGRVLEGEIIGEGSDADGDYWKMVVSGEGRRTVEGRVVYDEDGTAPASGAIGNEVRVVLADSPLSILASCAGYAITPYLPDSGRRVVLVVSAEDQAQVDGEADPFTVIDLLTGTEHTLRRTDCGAGCACAITFATP